MVSVHGMYEHVRRKLKHDTRLNWNLRNNLSNLNITQFISYKAITLMQYKEKL